MDKATRNDHARKALGLGCMFIQTAGVSSLPSDKQSSLREALEKFSAFTPDNDPYGEHDFGSIDQDGVKYFWKIDDFGDDRTSGNTHQLVLTLMEASEY